VNKKDLTEADIRTKFITPAIVASGWDLMTQFREEAYFTKGRVMVRGKTVARGEANKADYLLFYKPKEPWNGEYYVSFGGDCTWEDARVHGFVSAGGGTWYTQTLKALSPGNRVWVKIPGKGYVGVGRVTESVQSLGEFKLDGVPCLDVLKTADRLRECAADPEMIEAFVRVEWLDTVAENKAFNEIGLFGNQNTVCQPTTPKWRHTVERLKTYFKKWE
jgi:hypothetical protein